MLQLFPSRADSGFSLIETVIAATITLVAFVGLAELTVLAIASNQRARSRTLATVLAREKIEELMAADEQVAAGIDFLDFRGHQISVGGAQPAATFYLRRWSTEPMPATGDASVLQVSVVLARDPGSGDGARIVSLKSSGRR